MTTGIAALFSKILHYQLDDSDLTRIPAHTLVDKNGAAIAVANPLPVATSPGGSLSAGYDKALTLTRTADVNAYLGGDVLGASVAAGGGVLEFTNVGPAGGKVRIVASELLIEASALIATEGGYRLHLYDVTPPSNLADNAPWDLPSGDRNAYLGYIDLGTPIDVGASLFVQTDQSRDVRLAGTSLFAYLVTLAAHTPTSSRVYRPKIHTAAY